jgi:type IX secretion system PorP/SprF family membrane protein
VKLKLLLPFFAIQKPVCFRFILGVSGIILGMYGKIQAQDIQFSQFYAASPYLNPGLAGTKLYDRVISHSRIQWNGLEANYNSTMLSYDRGIDKINSGIGVVFIHDRQGESTFLSDEIQAQYSYVFNPARNVAVSSGLQLGVVQKRIGNELRFPDQFDIGGFNGNNSFDDFYNRDFTFIDIGAGTVIYTPKMWFGFSAYHLNNPNQSFINGKSILPKKFIFSTGYRFNLKGYYHSWITPTFQYKSQGKWDQFEMGVYTTLDKILFGGWYRGIPFKKLNVDLGNNESFVGMIGYQFTGQIQVSYSYDAVISGLYAISAGAHELNITFTSKHTNAHSKSLRRVICPPKAPQ